MKSYLSGFLTVSIVFLLALLFVTTVQNVKADTNHVVISEVQIGPGNNEFIELYNPTGNDFNLEGWHLTRKSSGSNTQTNLFPNGLTGIIPSHGYFLLVNEDNPSSNSADLTYATSVAYNSTLLLYSDNKITLVDKIGFGTNTDPESTASVNPSDGSSIERKANTDSTSQTMGLSGTDEFKGNGYDTDNNANDFVLRSIPQPQNSLSTIEPAPTATPTSTDTPTSSPTDTPTNTPSPTEEPTVSPTATATPTNTPSPTETPTVSPTESPTLTPTDTPTMTPTPTEEPTVTPTSTSTPTPTEEPTAAPSPTETPTLTPTTSPSESPTMTPTAQPSETPTLTPTDTPTMTPTPTLTLTPTPNQFTIATFTHFKFVCEFKNIRVKLFSSQINVPLLSCKSVKL